MIAAPQREPDESGVVARIADRSRGMAKRAAAQLAAALQAWDASPSGSFGILMYHRVAENVPGIARPTWNVTPEVLRQQLAGLLRLGFQPLPLGELVNRSRESQAIPAKTFAVTFDDGYENNHSHALPILRELNVPATIFLATKFLDCDWPFPSDDWSAAGSPRVPEIAWRPLRASQVEEMRALGPIEFGAHTHSHAHFLGNAAAFRADMLRCLNELQHRFGIERPTFAFPFGEYDDAMLGVCRELRLPCCVTTHVRCVRPGDDPLQWGRFHVEPHDTAMTLAGKLTGWYTAVTASPKAWARTLASNWRRRESSAGRSTDRIHEAQCGEAAGNPFQQVSP
jgi:peptidoglycan/xylan/chitin deacetylase (PgdA/CDA1 family)